MSSQSTNKKAGTAVAVGMGSNLPDRLDWLMRAAKELNRLLSDSRFSSVYETPPWGVEDQPHFLNAVVIGKTDLQPEALLHDLKTLETRLGRKQRVRYGPREIDLDLLAWNELSWSSPDLCLPHPRLPERDFVLLPFCELWPQWSHPVLGLSVAELWKELRETKRVSPKIFAPPLLSK